MIFVALFLVWSLALTQVEAATIKAGKHLTISGISSGGYMTNILTTAFSSEFSGSACFAGGVYYCGEGDIAQAYTEWIFQGGDGIDVDSISKKAENLAERGLIDDLDNLRRMKTFAFTGANDDIVPPKIGKKWTEFLEKYEADHRYYYEQDCGHCLPTDDLGNDANDIIHPFINNCSYFGAYEALKWVYSSRIRYSKGNFKYENIYKYDQTKFNHIPNCMRDEGFAYVPSNCQYEGADCPVHILFHGCLQTYEHIGFDMLTLTHYADLAEANDFIILHPQSVKSLTNIFNPRGCWDWWGYWEQDSEKFVTKEGVQPKAIMDAVHALQKGELELTHATEEVMEFTKWANKRFFDPEDPLPTFPSDY